ncbi:Protein PIF [Mizuhopecten yessoensis]|uniref:Protein PIF n=2 Tax=Mizuhopecten yessoensis TaxID=6573 RepID=A0A210QPW1_MIZYE|nr:Protein PIF [Mizuhopecten yessoensis]
MDFGKTVFMNIRYKQMDLKIDTEALLYNGDCEEIPTLVVGTKPSGNSFSVKTNTGAFQTAWVPSSVQTSDWRDVTITISNGRLEGQSGINARDIDVSGGIARSHCGIKLGWGKKFKNFVGCIDEVSIYRCIPNTRMALDGSISKSSITI